MSYRWRGVFYPDYDSLPNEAKGLPADAPAVEPDEETETEERQIITPTGPKTVKSKKTKAPEPEKTEAPEQPAE